MLNLEKFLKKTKKHYIRDDKIIQENLIEYIDDRIDDILNAESKGQVISIMADLEKAIVDRQENQKLHKISVNLMDTVLEKLTKKAK